MSNQVATRNLHMSVIGPCGPEDSGITPVPERKKRVMPGPSPLRSDVPPAASRFGSPPSFDFKARCGRGRLGASVLAGSQWILSRKYLRC